MKRQRGRNRGGGGSGGGGGKPQQNANRAFDSNGPDNVKVRGNAQHVFEKYQQLARDASSAGDRVLAENYLQHAEHYFRLLRAIQPTRPVSEIMGRDQFASGYDIDFEDESGQQALEEAPAEPAEAREEGGENRDQNRNRDRDRDRNDRGDRGEWQARDGGGENRNRDRDRDRWRDRDRDRDRNRDRPRNEGEDRPRDDRPRDDRPRDERPRDDRARDDRPRDDRQRDDRPRDRDDRPRDERPRDDRARDDRPRDRDDRDRDERPRDREDRPRFERNRDRDRRDDRGERQDPLAVVQPQGDPAPEGPMLRDADGGASHAPAFLQAATPRPAPVPAADDAEEKPARAPRRRRAPRATFEAGEGAPAPADSED